MPNWIEGTMKVRGTSEALMKFVENVFDANVNKHDGGDYVEYSIADWVYIRDSRRAFTWGQNYIGMDMPLDAVRIIMIPIRQAWSFSAAEGDEFRWLRLAQEYGVDIRLQGFECGMEFYQDLCIENGKITIDEVKEYENWDWDCPMSTLGG